MWFVGTTMRALLTSLGPALGTAALLVSLSACGGGAEEPTPPLISPTAQDLTPTAYAELASGLYGDHDPAGDPEPLLSQKESECVARALLDAFQVDGLVEIQVLDTSASYLGRPLAITQEQATTWVDAFGDCLDLRDYAFNIIRLGALSADPEGVKGDPEWNQARECVRDKVAEKDAAKILVAGLAAQPAPTTPGDPFTTCVAIAYPPAAG
jgi:hypothetical protein